MGTPESSEQKKGKVVGNLQHKSVCQGENIIHTEH